MVAGWLDVEVVINSCEHISDHALDVEADAGVIYRDDSTGQILDRKLVRMARQKELDFFESKLVGSLKAFEESRQRTGKPPCYRQVGGCE